MEFKRKLKNQAGLTLAETLLATLILVFAGMMLTSGASVMQKVFDNLVTGTNAQLLVSTAATALRNELDTARDVQVINNEVIYYDTSINALTKISCDERGIIVTPFVVESRYKTKAREGGDPPAGSSNYVAINEDTVSTLVTDAAANKTLYVTYKEVKKDEKNPDLIVFEDLNVFRKNDTENALASIKNLDIRVMTISGVKTESGDS